MTAIIRNFRDYRPAPEPSSDLGAQTVRVALRYAAWLRNMRLEAGWPDYHICIERVKDANLTADAYERACRSVAEALGL